MSSSSSSSSKNSTTVDERTTNTLNAGLSGDISDAFVAAGNYGDTSLAMDNSNRSVNMEDNSDRRIDNSVTHNTDGGAFDLVGKLIDTLGESQKETLGTANNLVGRSLDAAMSIKAGQTITEPANQTMRELAKTGMIIAGIATAGYVASKAVRG